MEDIRPAIELFQTINGYYVFDSNNDEVVEVEENLFNNLKEVLRGKKLEGNYLLSQYQNNGYFLPSKVEEILHPDSNNTQFILDNCIGQIVLQVTQSCNLRCKYCAYADVGNNKQRNHSSKRMSIETAKKAIDFYLERSKAAPSVIIGFYGGEPLIEFPLIKECVEYAEKRFLGRKLEFTITTNLTLINEEMVYFFSEHNFSLVLSIDGPQEVHDSNRKMYNNQGSFELVRKNLCLIKNIYSKEKLENHVSINMVLDPKNSYSKINELYEDSLFSEIRLSAGLVDDDYSTSESVVSEKYLIESRYNEFLSWLEQLNLVKDLGLTLLDKQFTSDIDDIYQKFKNKRGMLYPIMAPGGPCIPGQKRLFITADERLFPCERVSEVVEDFCIGSLDSGFDISKVNNLLNIGKLTEEKCKKCWAISHCVLCARNAENQGSLDGNKKLQNCYRTINNLEWQIKEYLLMKELKTIYNHLHCEGE